MTGHQKTIDVLVVGAGLSGLSAAFRATRCGATVEVLDAGDRAGGVIATERTSGHLVERGPTTMMSSPAVESLIADLDLEAEVVMPGAAAKRRYVVRNSRMHALPSSPASLATSRLLSSWGKLRAMAEPFVPRAPAKAPEETLAAMVRRRFGREVLDYFVDPFVSGVYAGNADRLSSHHAMRVLREMEMRHGSVVLGAVRSLRAGTPRGRMLSFRDGLTRLPDALAAALHNTVRYRRSVVAIRQRLGGWDVSAVGPHGWERHRAASVVLAAPAHALARIEFPSHLRRDLDVVCRVPYAPITTVALGFRREDVEHPLDGFGVLVPRVERARILGALFNSTLFPDRAPPGDVLVTCFLGGEGSRPAAVGDDAIRRACETLQPLIGIRGTPVMAQTFTWRHGIPQYEIGHHEILAAAERVEAGSPGLFLAGSYRGGVSLADCIARGLDTGSRALSRPGELPAGLTA
ncbi:MAG: protoporphyrinogen oxidase [bacterium]